MALKRALGRLSVQGPRGDRSRGRVSGPFCRFERLNPSPALRGDTYSKGPFMLAFG